MQIYLLFYTEAECYFFGINYSMWPSRDQRIPFINGIIFPRYSSRAPLYETSHALRAAWNHSPGIQHTPWTSLFLRFQRGWTLPGLCRVAVRNSSKFPLNSFLCWFWLWDREATGGICLFRLADDMQTKHASVTGFTDRAFGRSSFKKHKYCSILNSFHVFLQHRYLSGHESSSAVSQLWMMGDEDFDQVGFRPLIWSKSTSIHFCWAQENVHLPIQLLCLPANVLVTCCSGPAEAWTSEEGKKKM